jgi:ribonuclease VapC
MIKNILDASAVLAVLNGERGEKKVVPILAESAISTVNLTEVAAKLLDTGMDEAWKAAGLRPLTKAYGLSLGDRACLALSIKLKVPAVTADKEWSKLKLCRVLVIR